HIVAQ
ncbi:bacterial regulatory s, gntR family protein, partial [Vibrio harveyi]